MDRSSAYICTRESHVYPLWCTYTRGFCPVYVLNLQRISESRMWSLQHVYVPGRAPYTCYDFSVFRKHVSARMHMLWASRIRVKFVRRIRAGQFRIRGTYYRIYASMRTYTWRTNTYMCSVYLQRIRAENRFILL